MDLDIFKRYSCFFDPNIPDYVFFLSFVITSLLIAILLIVYERDRCEENGDGNFAC